MDYGYCQVCYAAPIGHPVRFSDVIAELRAIAALAGSASASTGAEIAGACFRVESLLTLLREQFMRDVVLGQPAPQPVA
jgi:hypothetical protein